MVTDGRRVLGTAKGRDTAGRRASRAGWTGIRSGCFVFAFTFETYSESDLIEMGPLQCL